MNRKSTLFNFFTRYETLTRNVFVLLAIVSLLVSSVPQNVLADDASASASDSGAASASASVQPAPSFPDLPDINLSDLLLATQPAGLSDQIPNPFIDSDGTDNGSAELMKKLVVTRLPKNTYQYKENISFDVYNSFTGGFKVKVVNKRGKTANFQLSENDLTNGVAVAINPTGGFSPGEYTLQVFQNGSVVSSQDFTWGVLAINTDRSVYNPGESADVAMTVLDATGNLVCDADVTLTITDPLGKVTSLTTKNGKVIVNSVCSEKTLTLTPDYEAIYAVGNALGTYGINLSATTKNGTYTVSDGFQVQASSPFDVKRIAPTRLYPPLTYPVSIQVTANQDFTGKVTEVLPADFQVFDASDASALKPNSIKTVAASGVQAPEHVSGVPDLAMPVAGASAVKVGFGDAISLIDPGEQALYRQYNLAGNDGVDFAVPPDSPVSSVDDGTVVMADENGPYGWTVVVQHTWGRTYYGHLSEFKVQVGQTVSKGQELALSGTDDSGDGSTVHFGVRLNKYNIHNGYYGKTDPAPLLGLPSDTQVLSQSTESENGQQTKVLTWNISVKKGDTFTLGYRFQAPPQSPEFYTIGPLHFFDSKQNTVFQETRPWQLAVDSSTTPYEIQTGYYIGNTNPVHITGLGFRPQLVIIKSDSNTLAAMFSTTLMPGPNTSYFIGTADSAAGWVNLENDGFTVSGSQSSANVRYTWIAFTGADCSATGMFCIGEYTGDTNSTQSITTGFQPDLVWVKRSTAVTGTFRTSSMPTNYGQDFDATAQDTTGALFTTLDSTGFTVGSTNDTSAGIYYYVAFKNTAGVVAVGSYTGTGSAQSITGLGFQPDWVFAKDGTAATPTSAVYNVTESYGDDSSYFTKTANLTGAITSLDSGGFSVGTNAIANGSGDTIYYVAFGGGDANSAGSGTFKMESGSYVGTGDYIRIGDLGFSPDLIIVKGNTTQPGVFRTSLMGGDSTAYLDSATANFAGGINAINPNGFTLGTSTTVNTSGVTYYWTAYGNAWDPTQDSGASDFYIGAYYGTGIDNNTITRLPFQADLLTVKRSGSTGGVFRTSSQSGDTSSYFAATNDAANNIQSLNSDGFQVGTNLNVNGSASIYWYFGFKDGASFTVGSYSGTGSAHNITSVGFQPDNIWVKRSAGTATRGVERTSAGATDSALPFINAAAITGAITGIVSNGFTVGTAAETDAASTTYWYVAWIDNYSPSTPTYQMQTGYYVGNTNPVQITGLGFRPQLVVIKSDSTTLAAIFSTTAMPGPNTAYFIANADSTTGFVNLEKDGFTVSSTASSANVRYTWIAFAGANCTSGGMFCIGEYTGNGSSTKSITAVGFQPDLVWVKRSTAVTGNWRSSSMPTNNGQGFDGTTDTTGVLFTTLDSTGFTVGTTNNASAGVYYYVAFKSTAGAVAVGSYTGTGTTAQNISGLGFQPDWVFVQNPGTTPIFNLTESDGDNSNFFYTSSGSSPGFILSLNSGSFTVGSNSGVINTSGNTIYYSAFGGAAANSSGSGTYDVAKGTYTGTGADIRISDLGFSPDLIIVKGNTTQAGVFRTSLMGGDSTAYLDAATANFAGGITAINPNGFTLGTSATVNTKTITYYWTAYGNAWNPETNTGASDFYIGAYYGNNNGGFQTNHNITRQPFQADMVTVKRFGATGGVFRTSAQSGDTSSYFAATNDAAQNIQALNSDGFEVGYNANVNTYNTVYFYFGFKDGADFTVGSYSGTGSAHNITSVGFQPDYLWVKRSAGTATRGVERTSDGATDSALPFINAAAITGAITGIVSNGFTVGTAAETDAASTTYQYVAWEISGTPPPTTPILSQLMRHGQWFNSSGVRQPFTF